MSKSASQNSVAVGSLVVSKPKWNLDPDCDDWFNCTETEIWGGGEAVVLSTVGVVLIGHLGVILDFDRGD